MFRHPFVLIQDSFHQTFITGVFWCELLKITTRGGRWGRFIPQDHEHYKVDCTVITSLEDPGEETFQTRVEGGRWDRNRRVFCSADATSFRTKSHSQILLSKYCTSILLWCMTCFTSSAGCWTTFMGFYFFRVKKINELIRKCMSSHL